MNVINKWIEYIELGHAFEKNSTETLSRCSFEYLINDFSSDNQISKNLCDLLNNQINHNEDVIKFVFSLDGDTFHFSNKNTEKDNDDKLNDLNRGLSLYEGEKLNIQLQIIINKKNQNINIYSLKTFSKYLKEQTSIELNKVLHEKFNRQDISEITFIVHDEIEAFSTSLFSFIPYHSTENEAPFRDPQVVDYDFTISTRNKSSHFSNASEWPFLPEDFKFNQDIIHEDIKSAFAALHNIYLLAFLCNMSSISTNGVSGSLVGYTTVQIDYPFSKIVNTNNDNLWLLYRWVYSVNATDKLGIARQIIPLHIKDNDLFSLSNGGLTSAQSNFTLFQKDNVKNYIEVTNKLAEQVSASSSKAGDIAKNISDSMRIAILGGLSFFTSVFLLRIMFKAETIKGLFTGEMLIVSNVVIGIFSIMFLVSIIESYMNQNHFINSYQNLKKIYSKVLTPEDIKEILEEDEMHKEDLCFIKKKRKIYISIFILTVVCTVYGFNKITVEESKVIDPAKSIAVSLESEKDKVPLKVEVDITHTTNIPKINH